MSRNCFWVVIVLVGLFTGLKVQALHVRHMMMVVDEELVDGVAFVHSLKSDQGKANESFLVDGAAVEKDDFYNQLEDAQLKESRKKREMIERRDRAKIEFADQAHATILQKLAAQSLQNVSSLIDRLQHDELKEFYLFDDVTIASLSELLEMRQFIDQAIKDLPGFVQDHDLAALQEIIDKVDGWQDKLEACFKDSVNNAIKQSDDTAMLKELLVMVSGD